MKDKKIHTFQLTIVDRDFACAPSRRLQSACAKLVNTIASPRVLLASTFETTWDIEHCTPDEQKSSHLIERAAVASFYIRSATDDCSRKTDNPVDWVEECVARFIEEYIGISRKEWPELAKKKKKSFDILCFASSAVWRDAIARICIRSKYFVRSYTVLAPIYNKNNSIEPTKATLCAKIIESLVSNPRTVNLSDQHPFVCKRVTHAE
jgi:hypothetical protein